MRFSFFLAVVFSLVTFEAQAVLINFTGGPTGNQANGFSPVGNSDISFTDTIGSNLDISDFGLQSDGLGLEVKGDDASKLQIDFSGFANGLRLEFGNDDRDFSNSGDVAVLQGFSGGAIVGTVAVVLNRNDLLDQSITLGALQIDQAFFFYADTLFNPINLVEIVDNISFNLGAIQTPAVPLPAALPLFGTGLAIMGFIGWRKKRKMVGTG